MSHPWVEFWLMRLIGALAGWWQPLDRAMDLLLRNDLLKGVPFAAALLMLWAVPQAPHQEAQRVSALRHCARRHRIAHGRTHPPKYHRKSKATDGSGHRGHVSGSV